MNNVFISSVIGDFETYRAAAAQAVRSMGHQAIMSENFGARAYSSEIACIHEVEQSDIYLIVLGERYGSKTPEGISVTHSEFRAARAANRPILAFVQNIEMEPEQAEFRQEVEDYQQGVFRASFSTTEELIVEIVQALRQREIMQQAASMDAFDERVQSALNVVNNNYNNDSKLVMAFWPQPISSVDIVGLESRLDERFHRLCQSDIAILRNGYEPINGDDWTGLRTGTVVYAQFDDGLIMLKQNPVMEGSGHFGGHFIQPARLEAVTRGFQSMCDATSGFVQIKLHNMEHTYVSEPPMGSSMSMRMAESEGTHFSNLFLPLTTATYNEWLEPCLRRFGRTYGYTTQGQW